MDNLKEATEKAVAMTIAQKILEGISTEHRDEILRGAVLSALKEYSFKRVIEEKVNAEATRIVERMLAEGEWISKIEASVKKGLEALLKKLPDAAEKAFARALFGKNSKSSYDTRAGAVAAYLLPENE